MFGGGGPGGKRAQVGFGDVVFGRGFYAELVLGEGS